MRGDTGSKFAAAAGVLPAGRVGRHCGTTLPEQEGDVAVLALSALHGAVQGQAGVSEGQVVQLAVHVVGVALEALEATETPERQRSAQIHNKAKWDKCGSLSCVIPRCRFINCGAIWWRRIKQTALVAVGAYCKVLLLKYFFFKKGKLVKMMSGFPENA